MKGPKTNDRRFPLPRRTGHGDFPHPALARVVYPRKHSQRHQAHVLQMSIKANALPRPPATLTAALQVFAPPMPHEVVEEPERLSRVAQLEVVGPSSQVSIQPPNQLRQGCMALMRVDELPQRLPFPRQRFARGLQVQVAPGSSSVLVLVVTEGVAQKVQALAGVSQVQHTSLFAVDLQPQPAFQFALNPAPQSRTDMAGQYDEVVRVANQLRLGPLRRSIRPLKEVVKPVQVDVGQQWTQDAPLRGAPVIAPHRRRFAVSRRFHHRCFKPLPNQPQNRAVHHAHPHTSDELVLWNAIEVAGQVRVIHRRLAFRQMRSDDAQRVVRRPAGSKPVRAILKVCLKDWLQYQQHRCLHHPVPHRRNAQRPQFSIGLGNVNSPHRLGAVGPLPQAPLDLVQKCRFPFRGRGNSFDAHSIYARCARVAPHRCPGSFQHIRPTHQPVETVEAIPLLLFGFLSQLLSQFPDARRQNRFPKGNFFPRLFCRRSFHFNQLRLPLTRHDPGQGSLAPSRLDREFFATMSPSDTPSRPAKRLWLPAGGCPRLSARTPGGVSQVPAGSFRARCLLSPRGVRTVRLIEASRPMWASPLSAGWPLPSKRNEAEPSSPDATARALTFPGLGAADCSPTLRGRLHDSRPSVMVNTFQLTRTAKLAWRFPKYTKS